MVAEELRKAVIEGFGKDFPSVNYGTPDYKMLSNLELNVYSFSGASNYQMLKSMTLALRDENGNIRSFNGFKKEAVKISGTYTGSNLKTEYDTAIASSQMAGKWVDFEKNKSVAEWLRYDTAGDSKVRKSHRLLEGIIKKVDDPFWDNYYPPNSWNCRCDVTQLIHGTETAASSITLPDDVPQIFKTNLAKQQIVFPDNHPYYNGLPNEIKKKTAALRNPQYSPLYKSKSGSVDVSSLADASDLKYNIQHATRLADHGESVRIRPDVQVQNGKNPELDLYKGSQLGDFKETKKATKNSYEKRIISMSDQNGSIPVMIMSDKNYNRLDMVRALNNDELWKKADKITEVWLMFEKALIKISREDIKLRNYYSKLP